MIDWLRNKSGIKLKTGALAGKRHDYFKGDALPFPPLDHGASSRFRCTHTTLVTIACL